MAQTGYTPIQLYSTSTASAVPVAGNLTNSTLGSELAINITDGKLFYKDNANAIQVIGWKTVPVSAGGTGLTSLTANGILYASGTSSMATGSGLTFDGTNFATTGTISGAGLTVTSTSALTASFNSNAGLVVTSARYSSDTAGSFYQFRKYRGSIASPATVATGDVIGSLAWVAFDGTALRTGSTITSSVETYTGTNDVSTDLRFLTRPTGVGAAATERARIFASGGVSIGNTTDPGATNLSVTGLTSAARFVPTGSTVPTNGMYLPAANTVGIATNSTEDIRFFSTGGVSIGDTTDPGAGNLRLGTGNLVIGTSGKGIDFSATAGTGTSELLADYEEGTWTPTDQSGASLTFTTADGYYTRIGREVYAHYFITYPVTTNGSNNAIGGLPFTAANVAAARGGSTLTYQEFNAVTGIYGPRNNTLFQLVNGVGNALTNATCSGKTIMGCIIYFT